MSLHSRIPCARSGRAIARTRVAVAALCTLLAGTAHALEIDSGNPDVAIRWDNTVRANAAVRVEGRDNKIGNSALADEGTYSFDNGDFVSKRLDLLSEFDVDLQEALRWPRISGTAWYDGAYGEPEP